MKQRIILIACGLLSACNLLWAADDDVVKEPVNGYPDFAIGIDASWTSRIEDEATCTYYMKNSSGDYEQTTIPDMAYSYGFDAIRLRVWVDPTNSVAKAGTFVIKEGNYTYSTVGTLGYSTKEDMLALAKRFAANGQRIMVSFQLSDTWADPGHQCIPASWSDCTTTEQLAERVGEHVTEVLTLMKEAGINVAWAQIGNEVNNGMLKYQLPTSATGTTTVTAESFGGAITESGAETTNKNFVALFKAGAEAAKAVYPDVKTVLHLTKTASWDTLNWSLALMYKAGLTPDVCDLIGLSLYPGVDDSNNNTSEWKTDAAGGLTTIKSIYSTYGFNTILCEIGMNNEWSTATTNYSSASQSAHISQCNTDVKAFTQYLLDNLSDTETSHCHGFFYWEAEEDYLDGYTKGACVPKTPGTGSSWPRTELTGNSFWDVCKEASSFPDGGLQEVAADEGLSSRTVLLYSDSWTAPYALSYNAADGKPSGNGTAMQEVSDGYYKLTTSDGDNRIVFSDNGSNSVTVSVPEGTTFVYNVGNAAWESEAYQAYDATGAEYVGTDEAYGLYYGYNLDYSYATINGLNNTASNAALELNLPSTLADGAYTATGIASQAFAEDTWNDKTHEHTGAIASVSVPSTITYIDYQAFYYCKSLTSVSLAEGLQSIAQQTFEGCTSLTSIEFPSTFTTFWVDDSWGTPFAWCSSLTTVDLSKCSQMTTIGQKVFAECNYLSTVYLPYTLDELADDAFTRTYPQSDSPTVGLYYKLNPQKSLTTFASCLADYYPDFAEVSGLTAYYAEKENDAGTAIVMQPVDGEAAQGEGLVLRATANATYIVPLATTSVDKISGNMLVGNTSNDSFMVSDGMYFLSDGEFCVAASDGTLAKGKAYLDLSSSSSKAFTLSFGDATGVSNINPSADKAAIYYNLSGQRVRNPQHGLYICNGNKVIM